MPSTETRRDVGVAVEVRAIFMAAVLDVLLTITILTALRVVCGLAFWPSELAACPVAVMAYIRTLRWIHGGAPFVD